jgi:hypothetical protein
MIFKAFGTVAGEPLLELHCCQNLIPFGLGGTDEFACEIGCILLGFALYKPHHLFFMFVHLGSPPGAENAIMFLNVSLLAPCVFATIE